METYLYKTGENYADFKSELDKMALIYDELKTSDVWFIIYCKNEQAEMLKLKGFDVSLDDFILETC